MSLGQLSGCPCVQCAVQIRSLGAILEGGGDTTNMLAWVNDPDNMSPVGWGDYHQGNFTDPSQTTPPGTSDSGCNTPGTCEPQNGLLQAIDAGEGCTIVQPNPPIVSRSQILLPVPTAYFVIAWGVSATCSSTGDQFALGCIFPVQADSAYPLLVDLPIPDNTLDDAILVQNYYFGIIHPGATIPGPGVLAQAMAILPDLSSLTPSNAGVAGFGPNWAGSIGTPCFGPTDDPFSGSDPP